MRSDFSLNNQKQANVAEDRRMCGVAGDWSTAALEPRACYTTQSNRCAKRVAGFTAAWVREAEKASETRQLDEERKRQKRQKRPTW